MSFFHDAAAGAAGLCKRIFSGKTLEAAREGVDILEAASVNRDHASIGASRPEHLKVIFAIAAGCAVAGVAVPMLGTGLGVSAASVALMQGAWFLGYRGLRVLMPYDPERVSDLRASGGIKNRVHNTLDYLEAVSLNRAHPWTAASPRGEFTAVAAMGAAGIGIGVALTAGTVGLPALAGVAITEAGKFAAYRAFRIMVPYGQPPAPDVAG